MKKKIVAVLTAIFMGTSICGAFPVQAEELTYGTGALDETLEEFVERSGTQLIDVSSNVATASALPSSVDLSTNAAFPCIDSQGSIGSCVAWATTYYQFTYEVNKFRGTVAKEMVDGEYVNIDENIYSPTWTYNYINGGEDNGTSTAYAYRVLQHQGAMTLADMPYDRYNYDEKAWSSDIEKMTDALKYRITSNTYSGITTSNLSVIKEKLASGHVGVITTYSKGWVIEQNSDGEYAIVCGSNDGGHAVAVVGYDDNFQITVNGETLTGAFKLANSWGENSIKHNDGYIWVVYDALNGNSSHGTAWQNGLKTRVGSSYNSSMREPIFKDNNPFTFVTVHECDVTFAGHVQYASLAPYNAILYARNGTTLTDDDEYLKWGNYLTESTSTSNTYANLVFDFFTLSDSGVYSGDSYNMNNCLSSYWTTLMKHPNVSASSRMRVQVIDNFGNTIAPANLTLTSLSSGSATKTISVNLAKGRVSAYDNSPITYDDSEMVQHYVIESIDLSNVQRYLADYNSDGAVNLLDVSNMNSDIAARNGETYAITDYIDEWGCSLADIIEEEYNMPIEQYVAENYAELSAIDAVPAELELY